MSDNNTSWTQRTTAAMETVAGVTGDPLRAWNERLVIALETAASVTGDPLLAWNERLVTAAEALADNPPTPGGNVATVVANAAARLALTGQSVLSCARQSDNGHLFILLVAGASVAGHWYDCGPAVAVAPSITSANNASFTVGTAGSFTITASGVPLAAITITGELPAGVTLTDHGDGTASLAGTPAAGSDAGSPYSLTVHAANGVSTAASQGFTLTVAAAVSDVKIYSGASVTPNLSAWSATFSGGGALRLSGNDVYAGNDLTALETNKNGGPATLDGEFVFDGLDEFTYFEPHYNPPIVAVTFSDCPLLSTANVSGIPTMASLSIQNCPAIATLYANDDAIANVDQIINAMNPLVSNGTLTLNGTSMGTPTSASADNLAALQSAGWTVTVNGGA